MLGKIEKKENNTSELPMKILIILNSDVLSITESNLVI
jgi:hypothetical protein